jgi:L-proline amide hydrolase
LYALDYCYSQAKLENNVKDMRGIERLRESVLNREESFPRVYVRKYRGAARLIDENRDLISGILLKPEYNLLDGIRYGIGIKVSDAALWKEQKTSNLTGEVKELKLPCYFVSGKYDYLTPMQMSKEYLDIIDAPKKDFFVFEKSAHYPHFEEEKAFSTLMLQIYEQVR